MAGLRLVGHGGDQIKPFFEFAEYGFEFGSVGAENVRPHLRVRSGKSGNAAIRGWQQRIGAFRAEPRKCICYEVR